jgi:hypothetical protein
LRSAFAALLQRSRDDFAAFIFDPFIHSLIHSFIHSLTFSLTHSSTRSTEPVIAKVIETYQNGQRCDETGQGRTTEVHIQCCEGMGVKGKYVTARDFYQVLGGLALIPAALLCSFFRCFPCFASLSAFFCFALFYFLTLCTLLLCFLSFCFFISVASWWYLIKPRA